MKDMHLMYGRAECNAKQFPNQHLPNKKTFQRNGERLGNTGAFKKRVLDGGRHIRTNSSEF